MRPASIVNFERIVALSIVLSIVSTFLTWDQVSNSPEVQQLGGGAVMGIQAVVILLYLLLLYFITRKGSPIAKWIYVVLAAIGVVVGVIGIGATFAMGPLVGLLAVVQLVLTAVSIWLLFRPDANAWFRDGRAEA